MLRFEAALARAQSRAGLMPAPAAEAIAAGCQIELFDVEAIFAQARLAGTPAIPLVKALTARVDETARGFVHWGATSQDAIDSALALQMRAGLEQIVGDLLAICARCAALANEHRHTPMAGRTLLQQALPISFGLKAARWLSLTGRQVRALRECAARDVVLQFGGAAGTLAALGAAGLPVAELLAEELRLPLPELPWHAERDRVARVGAALAIAAGAAAKIAGDLVLHAQTEVGELGEGSAPGKGGSSAMPHKRNPVDAIMALAAARLAQAQLPVLLAALASEHERAAGGWQAEWQALPALFGYTAEAAQRVRSALEGLWLDGGRMRANLELEHGLLMAESLMTTLAARVGREQARGLVETCAAQARQQGRSLRAVALADPALLTILSPEAVERALDPTAYVGSAEQFIERALAAYQTLLPE